MAPAFCWASDFFADVAAWEVREARLKTDWTPRAATGRGVFRRRWRKESRLAFFANEHMRWAVEIEGAGGAGRLCQSRMRMDVAVRANFAAGAGFFGIG